MAKATLEQAEQQHYEAVEANRDQDVASYRSGEKQSDQVWEVTEGYKYLPGGLRLGPGHRFHPTEKQVEDGSLGNKAREITKSEYRDLEQRGHIRRRSFAGADIGLRSIPMAEGTRELAMDAGLAESDFEGMEPGFEGRYTRAQVQELIERREPADGDE